MFKTSFKYYKSKKPLPCLDEVLDMNQSEQLLKESKIKQVFINSDEGHTIFGLKAPKEWEIFHLTCHSGLIFVKNPFTFSAQRYWTIRCLRDYPKKPNRMNIDNLTEMKGDSDFWELAQKERNILTSLRWTTLGYHHNWDTKLYNEEDRGEFPEDLKKLTEYIVSQVGYADFNAEAAIVNYYHMNSTLSPHTDHSEQNLAAPLISLSFGQSAIFLIGGKSLEEKPTAIFLRSGDIVIMSKEARLSYHAVPKIMRSECKPWETTNEDNKEAPFFIDESTWRPFGEYLGHSRININVRQVV